MLTEYWLDILTKITAFQFLHDSKRRNTFDFHFKTGIIFLRNSLIVMMYRREKCCAGTSNKWKIVFTTRFVRLNKTSLSVSVLKIYQIRFNLKMYEISFRPIRSFYLFLFTLPVEV